MKSSLPSQGFSSFRSLPDTTRTGAAFLLLSLFAGVLGGVIALPMVQVHPSSGVAVCHAVLMSLYVVCPAVLGGLGAWLLPSSLGASQTALPRFSHIAWCVLATGMVLLPLAPVVGLLLWAFGMVALACNVIASVLEERQVLFRQCSPLVWALLVAASSVVLVAPVIMALLVRGWTAAAVVQVLSVPEIILMIVPALGLIFEAIGPKKNSQHNRPIMTWFLAPYVFAVIGGVGPLLWAGHLLGKVPAEVMECVMPLCVSLPVVFFLAVLCYDAWCCSISFRASSLWAFSAIVLLVTGACLGEISFAESDMLSHIPVEHQAIVFGCLVALCAGFYRWCENHGNAGQNLMSAMTLRRFGIVHALLTVLGMLCSIVPLLSFGAPFFMGMSLAGFIIMGMVVTCIMVQWRIRQGDVAQDVRG